jgi:hypothetical protein
MNCPYSVRAGFHGLCAVAQLKGLVVRAPHNCRAWGFHGLCAVAQLKVRAGDHLRWFAQLVSTAYVPWHN